LLTRTYKRRWRSIQESRIAALPSLLLIEEQQY
jgi:hypothetical protein